MQDDLNLKARWSARKETVDECASRAMVCLLRMATCDDAFGQWFRKSKSRGQALANRVDMTIDSLRDALQRGRNRRDFDKTVIEELGFSMSLWNGSDREAGAGFYVGCGKYPDPVLLPGPNECRIDFPHGGPVAERLLQLGKLSEVVSAVVTSWDPDWALVSTYAMDGTIYPGV
jgi:hypothetical protein